MGDQESSELDEDRMKERKMNDEDNKTDRTVVEVDDDRVQLYNFKSNHTINHLKNGINGLKTTRPKCNTGLTLKERKAINIDAKCHLNWMLIILMFTMIHMYEFGYIQSKCKEHRSVMILLSRIVSSLTALETTIFYLVWFLLTKSKYYHMQIIYDFITGTHIFIAFFNMFYAVTTFLSRTCHEDKLTAHIDFDRFDKLHQFAIRYDLKLAGIFHILLTILVAFSAIHLTTKRSKFYFHYLTKRGLLTEYIWEALD